MMQARRGYHSGMGRPPLGLKKVVVRLPLGIGRRIDAVLRGKETRSELIRAAIETEIAKRLKAKSKPK
jgi:metal-responsive CopG/Arc/MetJ family transcriptional regulator